MVAVILISGIAVYSLVLTARDIAVAPSASPTTPLANLSTELVGDSLVNNFSLTLHNHGYFAIRGLDIAGRFYNGTNGTLLLGRAVAHPTTIPAGGAATVFADFAVNLSGPGGEYLATHNSSLGTTLWINWSYAFLYAFTVRFSFPFPWEPPFANLTYAAGAFTRETNGTAGANLTVAFANTAYLLNLSGVLRATVVSPTGAVCGSTAFPLQAPPGPVDRMAPIFLAASCPTTGDQVQGVFASPGALVTLPTEALT